MLRKLLFGLGVLILVPLLGAALVLLEAHWEIRSIEPPLPGTGEIAALPPPADGPVALRYLNTASQQIPGGAMSGHPVFEVEWADGRMLLIDAGMDREAAVEFGKPIESLLGADPMQPLGPAAEQLGAATRAVRAIAFTHLHIDHTQGLLPLCAAVDHDIQLFQTQWQAERGNYGTTPGSDVIEAAACVRRERLGDAPLQTVPGFPGVFAIAAGGHTPGSTAYVVRLAEHTFVLAGDVTNSFEALLRNEPKPRIYSLFIVPESPARLEELRLWLAELHELPAVTVVVSHDLSALQDSGIQAR